jgi:molybdopterin molybdotransferase
MISYEEALQKVLDVVSPLAPLEKALTDAAGLVLAAPAIARWDMPRCDNSAMDGFAISGVPEKTETEFAIIGNSYAGHPFSDRVLPGQATRITTGATLPDGTDTVVPIEDVMVRNGFVRLMKTPKVGQHIRYQGEEFLKGAVLADSGTTLHAGTIALLASAGIGRCKVFPRPCVAVISTGDELVELGQTPEPGQIVNSNLYFLKSRLAECGFDLATIGSASDDLNKLDQCFEQALDADIIISTGGVSVGEKDLLQQVLERQCFRKIFWKVAIKPGKPLLFGMLGQRPYFGLPGNPGATAATFELFAKPAMKRLAGQADVLPEKRRARLTHNVTGDGKRLALLWCRLEWDGNNYQVTVSKKQSSGQNQCLADANAILPVAAGAEQLEAGTDVEVLII